MFANVRTKELYSTHFHQIKWLSRNKSKISGTRQKQNQSSINDNASKNANSSNTSPAFSWNIQTEFPKYNNGQAKETIWRKNRCQIIRPDYNEERYNETSYYFENGLRKVYPYHYTRTSNARAHWIGETLLNICVNEFRTHSSDVYEKLIQNGMVTVNNQSVQPDYKIKKHDLLGNRVHNHEKPVLNQPIEIIHIDDNLVVINKPSSLPVFASGRYRHNTVQFVLAREYDLKGLYKIHRLDRLTSGILLFARNYKRQEEINYEIRQHLVEKRYVCRVQGEFPNGSIECNESIDDDNFKNGSCRVSASGKKSSTAFEKLSFNGRTSVVLCKPKTGRKHQIRVHLQHLGFPIINDPLYNYKHTAFVPFERRAGDFGSETDELLRKDFSAPTAKYRLKGDEKCENYRSVATEPLYGKFDNKFDPSKITIDENCSACRIIYPDPEPKNLIMYLHSLKYAGRRWSYETAMPKWANEDWMDDL